MKISLYTPPFSNLNSYYQVIDTAEKYGIKYVEIIASRELSEPNVEFARSLYDYANARGIAFSCVSVFANVTIENYEADVKRLKGFVDVAVALHSPYVHHTVVGSWENYAALEPHKDELFENGVKAVKEIVAYAKSKGVCALYEPQGFIFNGIEALSELAARVDIGFVADFGNVFFVDERIAPLIEKFPKKIKNVHLKDYLVVDTAPDCSTSKFGTHFVERPLGQGEVDFEGAFALLREIGYDGCVALESLCCDGDEVAEFEANLEFMKKLGCEL